MNEYILHIHKYYQFVMYSNIVTHEFLYNVELAELLILLEGLFVIVLSFFFISLVFIKLIASSRHCVLYSS